MYKIYNNNYHKKLNITENDLVKQTILNRIPNKNDTKDLSLTNPNFLPDCFSEFCDLFKEKLIQYDCK